LLVYKIFQWNIFNVKAQYNLKSIGGRKESLVRTSHKQRNHMHEINCPNCKTAFKIDEAGYADIQKQVRDSEFDKQIQERLALAEKEKQTAIELKKQELDNKMQQAEAAKNVEIQALQAKIEANEVNKKLAVTEALSQVEKDRDALSNELSQAKRDQQTAIELAEAKLSQKLQETASSKDQEIQSLQAKLDATQTQQQLAITGAVTVIEKERDELSNNLKQAKLEKQLAESSLKDKYETQIKDRDEAIERLKEMKVRLSTKMVGESLEQHCENEFNRIRALAFPRAYFEKELPKRIRQGQKREGL